MLDDLKLIHQRDKSDALGIAEKQYLQLTQKLVRNGNLDGTGIENIVYAGMGGSALAASYANVWPGFTVPFIIWRDYGLPSYVNDKTLVICASYSGNTEETLSALEAAQAASAKIAVIAGGGKLAEVATEKGYPTVTLPKFEQPRFAAFANFRAVIDIASQVGLLREDINQDLIEISDFISRQVASWLPTVPVTQNQAKQLALEVIGKTPVIYSGPLIAPAAYKWKISFNENAKNVAWQGVYPEFNHNEFMGWASHPIDKPYTVIDLRSRFENERIGKRFVITEKLLSGKRPHPEIVEIQGSTPAQQLFWASVLGDFVTIYTAILNGVDPTPVALVEKLKKELA